MQVTTTNGVMITLNADQIAEIDRQVKGMAKSLSIMNRIKSWGDAAKAISPPYYLTSSGTIQCTGMTGATVNHITSRKRAESVLAYCQLSVIIDALNEGWTFNYAPGNAAFGVYYSHTSKEFKVYSFVSSLDSTLLFKSSALAEYSMKQFPELWRQYFMLD